MYLCSQELIKEGAMMEQEGIPPAIPDLVFIDAILLSHRLGYVRFTEQKAALLASARAATDAISFMQAMDNFGVGDRSRLHSFLGEFLAAPAYYRAQYPTILGLHAKDEAPPSFLDNANVLFLVEPMLTPEQQEVLYDAYWWFSRNHQPFFFDVKKGRLIGVYSSAPQDNASTLERFEDYLFRLVNHSSQRVRQRYEGFPTEIVLAILKRAFL